MSLIRIGSRWLTPPAFTLLAILVSHCTGTEAPCAFGPGECGEGGSAGDGGAGGDVPMGGSGPTGKVRCGDGVCGVDVLADKCIGTFTCQGSGDASTCLGLEPMPGFDDKDKCTKDVCVDGDWSYIPLESSEMTDGDDCTKDYCDPAVGVLHEPIPGCGPT